ncbi:unnamed protein product, partial [Mesorhabditis belari]|uniref:Insulin-degrading enzyme n=1 Tax=Mesorhabditis belari TaxID=2138241 RepID=A0AAF3F2V3_9BILA
MPFFAASLLKSLKVPSAFRAFSSAGTSFNRLSPSTFRLLFITTSRLYSTTATKMAKPGIVVKRYDNIVKGAQDAREYRGLELTNGLRVLLISDPKADKSAAGIDVNVGHLMDPWELPGTAHFCEHMLFLGTDKYPSENEYSKFISSHGGMTNAFTSSDNTNYHFDIKPNELPGALDRFAQFFLAPQFTESATEREVCAVDSEHSNNLNNDNWRALQIDRNLSKPGHDHGKFGTGNKVTLLEEARQKGVEPREALLEFHRKYYSSNIMSLSILGCEPLDTLESYLEELGFSEIKNKNVPRHVWDEHPYGPEECGKMVEVVPIKDNSSLTVTFPYPDLRDEQCSQPAHYISHLIGHEGPGSLLSELKRRGWVSSLSAGHNAIAAGFGKFTIVVDLSQDGLENVDEIIALIFNEIGLIKSTGPQKWIQEELAELGEMKFRFKGRQRKPDELCDNAVKNYLMPDFKPEIITALLESMRPENMICRVVAKKFAGQPDNTNEPIYGTEMRITQISKEKMDRFTAALDEVHPNLSMPERNEYVATNFEIKETGKNEISSPRLIRDDQWLRVWFKQDDEFHLPKKITKINVTSPTIVSDPLSTVIGGVFTTCLLDALAEETYNPMLAGLSHSIDIGYNGIEIRVRGYDEKQNLFVRDLVRRMIHFKPDPLRFNVLKEEMRRSLRNFSHGQPYSLSQHYHLLLTAQKYWSKEQLLACCADVTVQDVEQFLEKALRGFHVEVFVHGNTIEQEVLDLSETVLSELRSIPIPSRPLYANECDLKRDHQLSIGSDFVFRHFQPTHPVSCVDLLLQCGVLENRGNVLLELLVQCMQEHAFNVLRTNEQLGYIVHTGARRFSGTQSLELLIQGPKTPDFVEERIEAYLEMARSSILEMSETDFNNHKEALATKRLEKPKTLGQRFIRFWNEIESREYDFTRAVDEVELLRKFTKEDLVEFFDLRIGKDAKERRKLIVMVHGSGDTKEAVAAEKASEREIRCIDSFRSGLPLWAHPRPKVEIPPPGAHYLSDLSEENELPNAKI